MEKRQVEETLEKIKEVRTFIEEANLLGKDSLNRKLSDIEMAIRNNSDPFIVACGERIYNSLHRAGIFFYEDLLKTTREDLLNVTNFGEASLRRLEYFMSLRGDSLRSEKEEAQ